MAKITTQGTDGLIGGAEHRHPSFSQRSGEGVVERTGIDDHDQGFERAIRQAWQPLGQRIRVIDFRWEGFQARSKGDNANHDCVDLRAIQQDANRALTYKAKKLVVVGGGRR